MEKNNVITKLTFNDKVNLITNFENWKEQNDLEILSVSKKVINFDNVLEALQNNHISLLTLVNTWDNDLIKQYLVGIFKEYYNNNARILCVYEDSFEKYNFPNTIKTNLKRIILAAAKDASISVCFEVNNEKDFGFIRACNAIIVPESLINVYVPTNHNILVKTAKSSAIPYISNLQLKDKDEIINQENDDTIYEVDSILNKIMKFYDSLVISTGVAASAEKTPSDIYEDSCVLLKYEYKILPLTTTQQLLMIGDEENKAVGEYLKTLKYNINYVEISNLNLNDLVLYNKVIILMDHKKEYLDLIKEVKKNKSDVIVFESSKDICDYSYSKNCDMLVELCTNGYFDKYLIGKIIKGEYTFFSKLAVNSIDGSYLVGDGINQNKNYRLNITSTDKRNLVCTVNNLTQKPLKIVLPVILENKYLIGYKKATIGTNSSKNIIIPLIGTATQYDLKSSAFSYINGTYNISIESTDKLLKCTNTECALVKTTVNKRYTLPEVRKESKAYIVMIVAVIINILALFIMSQTLNFRYAEDASILYILLVLDIIFLIVFAVANNKNKKRRITQKNTAKEIIDYDKLFTQEIKEHEELVQIEEKKVVKDQFENININLDAHEEKLSVRQQNIMLNSIRDMKSIDFYVKYFEQYLNEKGISIDYNTAANIISSIASSHVVFIKSSINNNGSILLKEIANFFSENVLIKNVINNTNGEEINFSGDFEIRKVLKKSENNLDKINVLAFDNLKADTCSTALRNILPFISNPKKELDLGKEVKLGRNNWFLFNLDESSRVDEIPETILKYAYVLNLDLVINEAVYQGSSVTVNRLNVMNYYQIVKLVNDSKKSFVVSENEWQKFDQFENHINEYITFRIDNKMFTQFENYFGVLLSANVNVNEGVDLLLAQKLIPLTYQSVVKNAREDDISLEEKVEQILGDENINHSSAMFRKLKVQQITE